MSEIEMTLETRIFGRRWALAERAAKPAWVQIEEQMADRIESGVLLPGERLPPERELADALGVSRMTVRQALASLAARGLVERGVGRGTFVSTLQKVEHDLSRVAGFTETVERQGLEPGAEILAAGEHAAPQAIAGALAIDTGAPAVRLERVRSSDGRAVAVEDAWLPAERFPGLLDRDLSGSLYALMDEVYGLAPASAVERLEPVAARPHEAAALGVAEGCPLMLVHRTAYAPGGVPVECSRHWHRGDRARFVVRVLPDGLLGGA